MLDQVGLATSSDHPEGDREEVVVVEEEEEEEEEEHPDRGWQPMEPQERPLPPDLPPEPPSQPQPNQN